MSRMHDRSESAERIAVWVETSVGSGTFELDERLRADEVTLRSDMEMSTAKISVRLDDGFDAEDCRRRYRPDLRLLIGTDKTEKGTRDILFEGYPPVQEACWDGRRGHGEESFGFVAEGVYERLSRARESQVFGRAILREGMSYGLITDPALWYRKVRRVAALPCIFNPDGVGNCSRVLLAVATPEGPSQWVPTFTYDGNAEAETWTYGRALRYLVWFHALREGPVHAGNVWEVTESTRHLQPADADQLARSAVLERTLLRGVDSLNCEATNLVEALGLWVESSGLHVTAETVGDGAGGGRTQLRVWSGETGLVCWLRLARGGRNEEGAERYPTAGRSVREILDDNDVYAAQVRWSEGQVVNAPIVIGDIKRHEMTVELKPGWIPTTGLDNVSAGDRAAAKADALVPEDVEALGSAAESMTWFQRYHRLGSDFRFYLNVARRWVLNEDGRYPGKIYNRNAPFDDYSAFAFSSVADETVVGEDGWMWRPRPMSSPITRSSEGGSLGVWVEISFDSGATWYRQGSGVRVLDEECGLYFDCENPTEITPPGTDPRDQNLWYAIVDQTFRVRMTGVIESDARLMVEVPASASQAGVLAVNAEMLYLPGRLRFSSREGTTNVLVDMDSEGSSVGRDDTAAAQLLADQVARQHQERQIQALPAIPWVDTSFSIGDRVAGVHGRELRFTTTGGLEGRYPAIVGKRYRFRGGRYETMLELERTSVRVR